MKTIKEKHQFIVDNYKTMTNKELAEKTGCSTGTTSYKIIFKNNLKIFPFLFGVSEKVSDICMAKQRGYSRNKIKT